MVCIKSLEQSVLREARRGGHSFLQVRVARGTVFILLYAFCVVSETKEE